MKCTGSVHSSNKHFRDPKFLGATENPMQFVLEICTLQMTGSFNYLEIAPLFTDFYGTSDTGENKVDPMLKPNL